MGFVKRVCKICGHKTDSYSQCGRGDCDKDANNALLPIREAIHDHCPYEFDPTPEGVEGPDTLGHGLCTKVGCMAETVPLGLVNPPIDGSVPPVEVLAPVRSMSRIEFRSTLLPGVSETLDQHFVLSEGDTVSIRIGDRTLTAEIDRQAPDGTWIAVVDTAIHPQVDSRD